MIFVDDVNFKIGSYEKTLIQTMCTYLRKDYILASSISTKEDRVRLLVNNCDQYYRDDETTGVQSSLFLELCECMDIPVIDFKRLAIEAIEELEERRKANGDLL